MILLDSDSYNYIPSANDMNITYDEFMYMQLERLSQHNNVIKIERLQGINNDKSNQFKVYYKKYINVIKITPNHEPHDTKFRLVNVWKR
jgi:hypothetical protein